MALEALEPSSQQELLRAARALAGETLGSVAARFGVAVPADLRREKGFVGQLVERALGARAGSRAGPDFPELGIELKTLPIDPRGQPLESTFVCTLGLSSVGDLEWEVSPVRRKLQRVLWVPVEGLRELRVSERHIGEPLLWSPSAEQEADLRHDWDELSGLVGRGLIEEVTGHRGRWLQIRPKAAHSRVRRATFTAGAGRIDQLPRGFYLRAVFTARIVREHYAISS
ncbi:MAG TPA: DNA mismatch repair endonuclease MutH [Polyangiaceae bacterium]|nr:DNA mismatch repair endonuclease MutH [Polyangiaceae bacterium]